MRLVVFGIAIGIVGVTIASQLLATLLFGITRLDPVTYLGVIALLIAVAAAACWFPARRAMRLDPMVALRHN
jgi:ABC-type antimicrobial peptide transport system permease subunit